MPSSSTASTSVWGSPHSRAGRHALDKTPTAFPPCRRWHSPPPFASTASRSGSGCLRGNSRTRSPSDAPSRLPRRHGEHARDVRPRPGSHAQGIDTMSGAPSFWRWARAFARRPAGRQAVPKHLRGREKQLDESAQSRFHLWNAGFRIMNEYPFSAPGLFAGEKLVPKFSPFKDEKEKASTTSPSTSVPARATSVLLALSHSSSSDGSAR